MDDKERLEIEITADAQQAKGEVNSLSGAMQGLSGLAAGAFAAGLAVTVAGIVALGGVLGVSVNAAGNAQRALFQTQAVLRSTGGVAGMTKDSIVDLANEMSRLTGIEDDNIVSTENLLLTFKSIGKDIFPEVTELALDMSQAFGQDMKASAIQLGKALEDPVQGVSALRRVGVSFTDAQQDLIKSLVESGNVLAAQKIILQEVKTEVGGSAEAFGKTLPGAVGKAENAWGNLLEKIGEPFLEPLTTFINDQGVPAIEHLTETIGPLAANLAGLLGPALDGVGKTFDPILKALDQFIFDVQNGMSPIEAFRNTFGQLIPPEFQQGFNDILTAFRQLELTLRNPEVQTQLRALGKAFLDMDVAAVAGTLKVLGSTLLGVATFLEQHGPAISAVLSGISFAFKFVEVTVKSLVDVMTGWSQVMNHLFKGDLQGAFQAFIKMISNYLEDWVGLFTDAPHQAVQGFIDGINKWTKPAREAVANLASQLSQVFKDILNIHSPSKVFEGFGKNIVDGLVVGIAEQPDAMYDALKGVVDVGIANIKRDLGIASPSKLFAALGGNLMEGLAVGIQMKANLPQSAMNQAISGVSNTAYNTQQQHFYSPIQIFYPAQSLGELLLTAPNSAGF